MPALTSIPLGPTNDAPFTRLWRGFLTGRVMVALALVALHGLSHVMNQMTPAVTAASVAYLAATLVIRALAHHGPPSPATGPHWLPTIGVDFLAFSVMQVLHGVATNYTPLLGLPILLAAVMGSLTLAMGAAATSTLLLLGWAWWTSSSAGLADDTSRYLQAALTGVAYFIVSYLVHQLASRLAGEQELARRSQLAARVQAQVSAAVVEYLSDGVLVVDDTDTVQIANPAALQLLGPQARMEPQFLLTDQTAWDPLVKLARRTFRKGEPQMADADLLTPGQSPTGLHVRTWLTTPSAEGHPGDERLCVMFLHDLREMEARLRTEKLAAMGRMSAAVAHEIRNPLAAIVQANALLEEDLQDPGQKRLSLMVRQNADRLARIAEDVLDIARVQHQISHAPATTLSLDDSVAQIWADWQRQDPAQRIARVTLEAPATHVEFDAEHLRRVLVNLLDNALRYMSRQPEALCLMTRISPNGQVSLQVWSDGAPMDKSVERHLFEPFFSSESRSSGLGLYICRELCQRHGASISYQRLVRQGPQGDVSGNAFTVMFRRTTRPAEPATLFDTIVV